MQNSGRQSGDYTTILVAKEKKLVALATVLVAISCPEFYFNLIKCRILNKGFHPSKPTNYEGGRAESKNLH